MKYLSLVLVVVGAVLAYGSKRIAAKVFGGKREVTDVDNIKIKIAGFLLVLIAAVITFLF